MEILWLTLALVVGAGIGLLIPRRSNQSKNDAEYEALRARGREQDRELEVARKELEENGERLDALKDKIAAAGTKFERFQSDFHSLQEQVKGFENLQAEMEADRKEAQALREELDAFNVRNDAAIKMATELKVTLEAELDAAKESLKSKEQEIVALLMERVGHVEDKRRLAAFMTTHRYTIHPDLGRVVYRPKAEQRAPVCRWMLRRGKGSPAPDHAMIARKIGLDGARNLYKRGVRLWCVKPLFCTTNVVGVCGHAPCAVKGDKQVIHG